MPKYLSEDDSSDISMTGTELRRQLQLLEPCLAYEYAVLFAFDGRMTFITKFNENGFAYAANIKFEDHITCKDLVYAMDNFEFDLSKKIRSDHNGIIYGIARIAVNDIMSEVVIYGEPININDDPYDKSCANIERSIFYKVKAPSGLSFDTSISTLPNINTGPGCIRR